MKENHMYTTITPEKLNPLTQEEIYIEYNYHNNIDEENIIENNQEFLESEENRLKSLLKHDPERIL